MFILGLDELRETVEKMKLQVAESNRQENILMARLSAKDHEVQDLFVSLTFDAYGLIYTYVRVNVACFNGKMSDAQSGSLGSHPGSHSS